jgi:hypothetical protein
MTSCHFYFNPFFSLKKSRGGGGGAALLALFSCDRVSSLSPRRSLFRHDEWRMPCYGSNATVGIDHMICILPLLNT